MACCAFGPCDRSVERGGRGCYLCDVVSKLPQQTRTAVHEDEKKEDASVLAARRDKAAATVSRRTLLADGAPDDPVERVARRRAAGRVEKTPARKAR